MSIFKSEYLDKVRAMIAKHGVMIQYVGGGHCEDPEHVGEDDGDGLPFAYTVGLAAIDEPELVIFGLLPKVAAGILNDMAIPVAKGQRISGWQAGLSYKIFGNGVPALLIEVKDSNEYLFLSNTMYAIPGQGPVPALQVLFPDANGRWPWDSKSDYFGKVPILGTLPTVVP